MSYASGDFKSARGGSAAVSVTAGQDIATHAANTADAGGSTTATPTAAAAAKNDTTNPKLSNQKLKANTEQDCMEPDKLSLEKDNKNSNLPDLNDEAMEDNQLEDQEYDDDDRANAPMPNVRYTFLVDVMVDIIVDVMVDVMEDVMEDVMVDVMVDANDCIETSSNYISTTYSAERT